MKIDADKAMDAIGTGILCGSIWLCLVAAVLVVAALALRAILGLGACVVGLQC